MPLFKLQRQPPVLYIPGGQVPPARASRTRGATSTAVIINTDKRRRALLLCMVAVRACHLVLTCLHMGYHQHMLELSSRDDAPAGSVADALVTGSNAVLGYSYPGTGTRVPVLLCTYSGTRIHAKTGKSKSSHRKAKKKVPLTRYRAVVLYS